MSDYLAVTVFFTDVIENAFHKYTTHSFLSLRAEAKQSLLWLNQGIASSLLLLAMTNLLLYLVTFWNVMSITTR